MCSFAIYRLPYAKEATLIQQTEGEPAEYLSCTELNGKSGYVVAPFEVTKQQPILVIRPDKVHNVLVEGERWKEITLEEIYTFLLPPPIITPLISQTTILSWRMACFVRLF